MNRCEETSHEPKDNDKATFRCEVADRDGDGEILQMYLCEACIEELAQCGIVVRR